MVVVMTHDQRRTWLWRLRRRGLAGSGVSINYLPIHTAMKFWSFGIGAIELSRHQHRESRIGRQGSVELAQQAADGLRGRRSGFSDRRETRCEPAPFDAIGFRRNDSP